MFYENIFFFGYHVFLEKIIFEEGVFPNAMVFTLFCETCETSSYIVDKKK